MSKKLNSCVDSDGRRYKKSKLCDCCDSPTTSQESEDAGEFDDCDVKEHELGRWIGHHPNSSSAIAYDSDDGSVHSKNEAKEETAAVLKEKDVLTTPEVKATSSHVASSNPSLSTTSTPTLIDRKKSYTPYKKRKFKQLRHQQEAIMDAILSKQDSERKTIKQKLESTEKMVNSTMTQHFDTRSKMAEKKRHSTYKIAESKKTDENVLFKKDASVFQSEDELDISPCDIRWKKMDFKDEVDKHEKKFFICPDKSELRKGGKIKKRPVYKPFAKRLETSENYFCTKCNNLGSSCHDVVIGPFCRDAFVRYFHEESKKYADLLVAKKTFFANYDNYSEIKEYEAAGRLCIPKSKNTPPGCVMHGAYGFCIDWFNYMKNDGFTSKKIDKSKPFVYDINDFKRL